MQQHKKKLEFICNKLELICYCQALNISEKSTLEDFIEQSQIHIQAHVNFFDYMHSNLKFKKTKQNLTNLLKKISSLIYDLKFLQSQIQNNNISLDVKYMNYFKHFHVDDEYKIDFKFQNYIMQDFNKMILAYQIEQSNIKIITFFENIKIIQMDQIKQKIWIKEIYKDQKFYLQLNLYSKYDFTLLIGQQSLIEMLYKELKDQIVKMVGYLWDNYSNLDGSVVRNWLIADFNLDQLFSEKKQIVDRTILSSVIVKETYNGESEKDFEQRDYNDIFKKQILSDVKNNLLKVNSKTFLINAITQIIDQKLDFNFYDHEELTSTQYTLLHQINNLIDEEQIYISEQSYSSEQIYSHEQSINMGQNILIQQLQNLNIIQRNQSQYITQSLLQYNENQPNFQNRCQNLFKIQWLLLNLAELINSVNFTDLEKDQIILYFYIQQFDSH